MFDRELNKMKEEQEDQKNLIKVNENKQNKDHKLVLSLIKQLTSSLDIIKNSLLLQSINNLEDHQNEEPIHEQQSFLVSPMEVDRESAKRKEGSQITRTSLRKSRTSKLE